VQVPDDDEWAFEAETDLWDDGETPAQSQEHEPEPSGPTGRDPDRVVTVAVSAEAAILRVKLDADWKSKVDPRALDTSVLTAANAATIDALLRQTREVQENPPSPIHSAADETPLTARDVLRLGDAVLAEVDEISARLVVADRTVAATSSGGHVSGTAQSGRYVSLDIDPTWASIARNAEVEAELTEILRSLHRASVPDCAGRHVGKVTAELLSLVHDPDRLIRRVQFRGSRPEATRGAEDR
jgi:DNA-binding protein YbaB